MLGTAPPTRAYLEPMNQGTDRAKWQSDEALAAFA
jgi:hypothetical protein